MTLPLGTAPTTEHPEERQGMSFILKRRFKPRRKLRKSSSLLVILLVASLLGVVIPAPSAEAQQTPNRPLLLVMGTGGPTDYPDVISLAAWLNQEFGYVPNQDLFTIDLAKPDPEPNNDPPPNWPGPALINKPFPTPDYWVPSWNTVVQGLAGLGGTTAGLGSMEDSTARVLFMVTSILNQTQADEIDIIGISQGAPVARKYIRNTVEDGLDNPVNRMISFSGANNGTTTNMAYVSVWDWLFNYWEALFSGQFNAFLEDCRDNNWLPFCPDMIVLNEEPSNTISDFLPDLNAPADPNDPEDPGPVPGPTDYYHVYTDTLANGDPNGIAEHGEGWMLPDEEPNVMNVSAQGICAIANPGNPPDVHVDHADVTDDVMRELVAFGLGYRLPDTDVCPEPPQ